MPAHRARFLAALAVLHRWLGGVGCLAFVGWFASGLVMIYAGMPALEPAARARRLPPLDWSRAAVSPGEAAARAGLTPRRIRLGTLLDRPAYRVHDGRSWHALFADDGRTLTHLSAAQALALAAAFDRSCAAGRTDRYLVRPDQWTLQLRDLLPAWRVGCGDRAGTALYVSERTGEVVLETTRRARVLGHLGPVVHWWYWAPLRANAGLWRRLVLWGSAAGCLLALSGLWLGYARISPRRARASGALGAAAVSPYSGLLRWHHLAGLLFGATTFTWMLSGGLSLDPLDWHAGTAPSAEQRRAFAGGEAATDLLVPERVRAALVASASLVASDPLVGSDPLVALAPAARASGAPASGFAARELEVVVVGGETYLLAYGGPLAGRAVTRDPRAFLSQVLPLEHRLVRLGSADTAGVAVVAEVAEPLLLRAARAAVPAPLEVRVERLERYDAYYTDRERALPLPVLRLRFADPARTWLTVDPARALVVRREEHTSRLNRWLFRGLHRFDLPGLYQRRPLWDLVVIALLLGGLSLSLFPVVPFLRRLGRSIGRVLPGSADRK